MVPDRFLDLFEVDPEEFEPNTRVQDKGCPIIRYKILVTRPHRCRFIHRLYQTISMCMAYANQWRNTQTHVATCCSMKLGSYLKLVSWFANLFKGTGHPIPVKPVIDDSRHQLDEAHVAEKLLVQLKVPCEFFWEPTVRSSDSWHGSELYISGLCRRCSMRYLEDPWAILTYFAHLYLIVPSIDFPLASMVAPTPTCPDFEGLGLRGDASQSCSSTGFTIQNDSGHV